MKHLTMALALGLAACAPTEPEEPTAEPRGADPPVAFALIELYTSEG